MEIRRYLELIKSNVNLPSKYIAQEEQGIEKILRSLIIDNAYSGALSLEDLPLLVKNIIPKAPWLYDSRINLDRILAWGNCVLEIENKLFKNATIFVTDRNIILSYKPTFGREIFLDVCLSDVIRVSETLDFGNSNGWQEVGPSYSLDLWLACAVYDAEGPIQVGEKQPDGSRKYTTLSNFNLKIITAELSWDKDENRRIATWSYALSSLLENSSFPASEIEGENKDWQIFLQSIKRNLGTTENQLVRPNIAHERTAWLEPFEDNGEIIKLVYTYPNRVFIGHRGDSYTIVDNNDSGITFTQSGIIKNPQAKLYTSIKEETGYDRGHLFTELNFGDLSKLKLSSILESLGLLEELDFGVEDPKLQLMLSQDNTKVYLELSFSLSEMSYGKAAYLLEQFTLVREMIFIQENYSTEIALAWKNSYMLYRY
jgi:hypothetical protein